VTKLFRRPLETTLSKGEGDDDREDQRTIGSEATSGMMGSFCEVKIKHETTLSLQLV